MIQKSNYAKLPLLSRLMAMQSHSFFRKVTLHGFILIESQHCYYYQHCVYAHELYDAQQVFSTIACNST